MTLLLFTVGVNNFLGENMSNYTRQSADYSFSQPLNFVNPNPIISLRVPTTADKAPLGTLWVDKVTNAAYVITSVANNLANWANFTGGALNLSSLTVTPGPINLTGAFTLVAAGNTVHFADDAAANTVIINSQTGAGTTTINSGTGGIALQPSSHILTVSEEFDTVASPTNTIAITGTIGVANFTGFTTGAAASQAFILTNASITTASGILITAANTGANAALMTVERVLPAAGSVTVTLVNNGAAALDGNVNIAYWIFSF
jgi:hypothetical protein